MRKLLIYPYIMLHKRPGTFYVNFGIQGPQGMVGLYFTLNKYHLRYLQNIYVG